MSSPIKATKDGNVLHLEITLEAPRPSSTGKMLLSYTSGGFQQVLADGTRVNLTVGHYPPR